MSWKARRYKKLTRHHVLPKCRGGGDERNIIRLRKEKHEAWHTLFGTMTFQEAAELLLRADRTLKE